MKRTLYTYLKLYFSISGVLIFLNYFDQAVLISTSAMLTMLFSIFLVFLIGFFTQWSKQRALKQKAQELLLYFENDCAIEASKHDEIFTPLIQRNLALKKLMNDKERYSTVWVHDIKLPLATLQLFYNNNQSKLTNEQKLVLSQLIIEFEDKITQRIQLDKLSSFENDFVVEKIDILKETRAVIKKLSSLCILKNISIEFNMLEEQIFILSDAKVVEYALSQILTNSLNYSHDNSKIKISSYIKDKLYYLQITDYGVGIASQDLGRVFDFGFTGVNGRSKRSYAASGIGLHIVKEQFNQLGHLIAIESELNQYTTVTLAFKIT